MKKTLSITLGGRIFSIEEDGYTALDAYLKSLRAHFASDPSVDELVHDIEFSFGEKFSEKLTKDKQVVTLSDVESVIAVVGRVEEIADEDTYTSPSEEPAKEAAHEPSSSAKRRLYRNPDDRLIAGVCSGLAVYFDVDPLIIRILAIALTFVNGLGLILYLVFWVSIPAAETSLQKLEMQGKEPNLNEFQELTKDKPTNAQQEGRLYRLLNAPLRLIGFVFDGLKRFFGLFGSVIRVIAGASLLFFAFVLTTLGTMALIVFATNVQSRYVTSDLPLNELAQNPLYYVGLGSVYLLALIPLAFFAILGVSLLRRKNQFNIAATSLLIGVWILAAGGAAAAGSHLGPWAYTHIRASEERAVTNRAIQTDSFERIHVSDNLRLTVRQGATTSITFSGPEEELARIQATTSNGILTLSQASRKEKEFRLCFACFNKQVSGVITLPTLTAFSGRGNSSSQIEDFSQDLQLALQQNADATVSGLGRSGTSTAQQLTVLLEDNSYLRLIGNSDRLRATLKDNARLNAEHLDATHVEITAEDNTHAQVSPIQSFAATTTHNSSIRSTNEATSSTVSERQNSRVYVNQRPSAPSSGACAPAGCSSQLCVDADKATDTVSTCEFRDSYACYRTAHCERQTTGECGWTQTAELRACLQNPPPLQ